MYRLWRWIYAYYIFVPTRHGYGLRHGSAHCQTFLYRQQSVNRSACLCSADRLPKRRDVCLGTTERPLAVLANTDAALRLTRVRQGIRCRKLSESVRSVNAYIRIVHVILSITIRTFSMERQIDRRYCFSRFRWYFFYCLMKRTCICISFKSCNTYER